MTDTTQNDPGRAYEAPSERNARWNRRASLGGLGCSAVLHVLLFVLWVNDVPLGDGAPPGEAQPELDVGGGGLQAMNVSVPRQREITPPPRPIETVDVPEVEIREIETPQIGGDLLPVANPAPLPGIGGGPGAGEGGQGGSGEGYSQPIPRSVVPHWDPPGSVRGLEVTVRVFVDATGRPSLVELDPPTPDDGFNREIMREVRGWEYRPARREGVPVEGWAEITFIF